MTVPMPMPPAQNPGNESPFDAIKQTDQDGEFWSARDMQTPLDYEQWRDFANAVERAKAACLNSGHQPEHHFAPVRKVIKGGRWGEQEVDDFRLTRYASYLLAMNSDPRKEAVATAQTYFAQKTREAETALAFDPASLSRLDILRLAMQAEEEKAVLEAALESAAPAIAYHDRYVSDDDVTLMKVWAAQFGLTEPQARDLLVEKNIIYRLLIGERWSEKERRKVPEYEWRARAGRVTFAWFDLRPQHNVRRHHNGQVRQTLYIRQFFALDLARKVGLTQPQIPGTDVALRGGDAA